MKDWAILILVVSLGFNFPGSGDKKISTAVKVPVNSINQQDTMQYDGPYVFYKNDKVFTEYILQVGVSKIVKEDSVALSQKQNIVLKVNTDEPGKFFSVRLKDKLEEEKDVTKKVSKVFACSDIEGNFAGFRKLLQGNGIIDNSLNWSFGDGHLVLIGDFFDRGEQVTEVLWFIYLLEEKAKAAGGYVHFILGNHEIMNLSSDLRYVNAKYTNNAVLLGERYESLYTANTELGRWLRTKNVIERVGDVLYLHAGISSEINRLAMSVRDINKLARPYYADTLYDYKDPRQGLIMADLGPFWYRGYYTGKTKATQEQVDSTLWQYNVRHIATGHTIVADTVSVWYDGKVFNTDVHHAAGKSEALLIEGDNYYRVSATGNKLLLMEK
ncbi:MAG: metallophosphoesterase [Bacteroidota bacterium]